MLTFINEQIATIVSPLVGGFQGIWQTIRDNYLQWIFFISGVIVLAIYFLRDRKWTVWLSFFAVAGVIGLLIFGGEGLAGGDVTNAAKGRGKLW